MKKSFAIAALTFGVIVLGTNTVQAQNTTATTTATITLGDVISIDAGSSAIGGTVAFNYATAADYNSAQTVTQDNAIKVTSTKNFTVNVKAEGANFQNGVNLIPVNVLTIKAATGGNMAGTQNTVVLSTTNQPLIVNAPLGSARTLNIDYTIPAAKSSSSDILGKPAGVYTQKVIYTATAL
ncbi:peptidoglycan-binding protein LysM [Marnyiella aurantia]|uniref:Peptidoglycan-binding protein LysM n=1 Tax=Marnyiella aurantia TaxID=2758037 RepID=A0A7D7LSU3_9FLAO|nr:peptidoglycan-binding protein LysM [Marnyiella aurantia]MBA5245591.1 peptidoglycan-binding protein LysM [Marnyiella aurantia]QMS98998.1 peptidoglycan-binding protein LysM [Marnyiella aurantia]